MYSIWALTTKSHNCDVRLYVTKHCRCQYKYEHCLISPELHVFRSRLNAECFQLGALCWANETTTSCKMWMYALTSGSRSCLAAWGDPTAHLSPSQSPSVAPSWSPSPLPQSNPPAHPRSTTEHSAKCFHLFHEGFIHLGSVERCRKQIELG